MAERIVRITKHIRREVEAVREQFMDLHHHARGGVHPDLTFTVLESAPKRVLFQQEARLLGLKQVDQVEALQNSDGSVDYIFKSGMNTGSRIHFDFRKDGDVTVVDATAYLKLNGWKRLIGGPFARAFKKIGEKALEEDRRDLESGRYQRAA
jgi:hypothetical protein